VVSAPGVGLVRLRDFAAADIGQANRPGYGAGALLAPATDVTVSPLNMRHVPRGRASLHDGLRLSSRQVRGHHRILVIRLVDSTRTGLAMDHGITSGVWGGTTEDERRALRRPAKKKSQPIRPVTGSCRQQVGQLPVYPPQDGGAQ
jgi:hypothetical protein